MFPISMHSLLDDARRPGPSTEGAEFVGLADGHRRATPGVVASTSSRRSRRANAGPVGPFSESTEELLLASTEALGAVAVLSVLLEVKGDGESCLRRPVTLQGASGQQLLARIATYPISYSDHRAIQSSGAVSWAVSWVVLGPP